MHAVACTVPYERRSSHSAILLIFQQGWYLTLLTHYWECHHVQARMAMEALPSFGCMRIPLLRGYMQSEGKYNKPLYKRHGFSLCWQVYTFLSMSWIESLTLIHVVLFIILLTKTPPVLLFFDFSRIHIANLSLLLFPIPQMILLVMLK